MAVQIEQGQELHRESAKGLYHFVSENAYEIPDDMNFLSGIDDEYALAENRTYGSVDEINDRLFNELKGFINPAIKKSVAVMPDLIRHPVFAWIPAFAGMTSGGVFNCRSNKSEQNASPDWYSAVLHTSR